MSTRTIGIAKKYMDRGWRPVPVLYRDKKPWDIQADRELSDWALACRTAEDISRYFNGHDQNIGIALGEHSDGLIDIDLDCPEALAVAPHFLPATLCFGRKTAPVSHWLYHCEPPPGTVKFQRHKLHTDDKKVMVAELRSTGAQTVAPGSIHKTGEKIEWVNQLIQPTTVDGKELSLRVGRLAAAALLVRYWVKGVRDDLAATISGILIRAEWSTEDADKFIETVAEAAGDEEIRQRRKARWTEKAIGTDHHIFGIPKLHALLGADADNVIQWLGLKLHATFAEVMTAAETLGKDSSPDRINDVLMQGKELDPLEQDKILTTIKTLTGVGIGVLKKTLQEKNSRRDVALRVAENTLDERWAGGAHLIRGIDRSFWGYTGTHWHRLTDEQVKNGLLEVIRVTAIPQLDGSFSSILNAAFNLLAARQAAEGDVLRLAEEPPPVVNCLNGELWIADDGEIELRPHRADSYLTYVLDVEYRFEAQCPLFDQTLLEIFKNAPDMARHVEEILGYAIQPKRDIPTWLMLLGPGSNGKSKLVQTLETLVNKRAVYCDRIGDIESSVFKRGALAGKLLLIDDDVDEGTKLPDGFLKSISERKTISGQLKFKDSFEFTACCLPILLANNPPLSKDLSYGLRRRAHIVPFDRIFYPDADTAAKKGDPEAVADPGLFPRIWRDELPGVLNRLLEGLKRLRVRGRFDDPPACVEARRNWLAAANPLVAFTKDVCFQHPSAHVGVKPFYQALRSWAYEEGIKSLPPRNAVRRQMAALGYEEKRTNEGWAVIGLVIPDEYLWAGADF